MYVLYLNPKPNANEIAKDEREDRHTQTQAGHFQKTLAKRFILCNRNIVIENCDDNDRSGERDGEIEIIIFEQKVRENQKEDGADICNARIDCRTHGVFIGFL